MAKVLVLFEYPTVNGGERSFLSVWEGLRSAGYQVSAAVPAQGAMARELADRGMTIYPLALDDGAGHRRPHAEIKSHFAEIFRESQPDLIHANSVSVSRLSGRVAREMEIPSIGHLRDIVRLSRAAVAELRQHVRLLAVSHATRNWYLRIGVEPDRVHVVYNGVDLDDFRPRRPSGFLHRELGLPSGARLIGTIGQIGLRKGLDVLLAAAPQVVSRQADVHFLVVGQRFSRKREAVDFEQQLRRLSSHRLLAGHVHFLGWRPDVPRLLNELSLLVHPARQEPLGRVLLEAAASGVAVLATDVGGTAEIFPNGCGAARLMEADNPIVLGQEVIQLLQNPRALDEMAKAGRRRARSAFDAHLAAKSLARHFQEIMN